MFVRKIGQNLCFLAWSELDKNHLAYRIEKYQSKVPLIWLSYDYETEEHTISHHGPLVGQMEFSVDTFLEIPDRTQCNLFFTV